MRILVYSAIAFFFVLSSCKEETKKTEDNTPSAPKEEFVPSLDYSVVKRLPHDTISFTEGFLYHNGQLFESTGSPEEFPEAESMFGIIDPKTGKINKKGELDKKYFGEGIVILNEKLYQLTYKDHLGFEYDLKTFKLLRRFNFDNEEGWGLTTDGKNLIMSDGTNILTYLDPATLKPVKKINVSNGGYAEDNINELEFINGSVYANVWTKNYIIRIDTASGKVNGLLDLSNLVDESRRKYRRAEVLNGIAFDADSNRVYVTGKFWPEIYQIDFKH